jgi:hypothetical protein
MAEGQEGTSEVDRHVLVLTVVVVGTELCTLSKEIELYDQNKFYCEYT